MSRTLGHFVDENATLTQNALWHARSHTRLFLADALDETAKMLLETWFLTHDASVFYLEFFNRYAIVFARPTHLHGAWSCRNPSACAMALMWELSAVR